MLILLQNDAEDFPFKKKRFLVQDTKKFGCHAQIIVKDVLKFPEFKVKVATT